MGKKVHHVANVTVDENGICKGWLAIQHGSLKHNSETTGTEVNWRCNVDGVDIVQLLQIDACANISVRMASIREFDFTEFDTKRSELDGSVVAYGDISSWTTRGQKGRRKISDLSPEELLDKMTPEQKRALLAMLAKA